MRKVRYNKMHEFAYVHEKYNCHSICTFHGTFGLELLAGTPGEVCCEIQHSYGIAFTFCLDSRWWLISKLYISITSPSPSFLSLLPFLSLLQNFLTNVHGEVVHNVRRMGHHPSIVLWSGNNENQVKTMCVRTHTHTHTHTCVHACTCARPCFWRRRRRRRRQRRVKRKRKREQREER